METDYACPIMHQIIRISLIMSCWGSCRSGLLVSLIICQSFLMSVRTLSRICAVIARSLFFSLSWTRLCSTNLFWISWQAEHFTSVRWIKIFFTENFVPIDFFWTSIDYPFTAWYQSPFSNPVVIFFVLQSSQTI